MMVNFYLTEFCQFLCCRIYLDSIEFLIFFLSQFFTIYYFFIDAEEEKKKEEMLKVAKKELEDWYKTHEEQIAKTKAANRYYYCLLQLEKIHYLSFQNLV